MLLLALFACTDPKPADTGTPDTADTGDTGDTGGDGLDAARDALRQKVKSAVRTGQASGAQVAVWKSGEIVFSEGIGTRDPDTEDPVLTTTLFEVGSDTKKMTAMAILQQVAAGRTTLDATVAEVLPAFTIAASPDWAATTTLHELLSHQGGLVDYTPWDDVPEDAELGDRFYGRFAADGWAMLPSGTAYNYANPNFSLAGLVVEELEGAPYADVLRANLFEPLGLTRTFAREAEVEADGDYAVGSGYYLTEDAETFYPLTETMPFAFGRVDLGRHPDNGFTRPAGLVWSTAEDMAHLVAFLMEGGDDAVLPDDLRALVTTPHVATYPHVAIQGYGYGVSVLPEGFSGFQGWHPTPYWTHGGNTLSYTSTWCALPEYDLIVTIQSNGYGDQMAEACVVGLEGFADLPVSETPEIYEDVGPLEDYVGTWHDPHTVGTIEVTTDGAELFVSMPDLEAVGIDVGETLTPYAKDLFTVTLYGQPYEITFYAGADGEKQYIVDRLFAAERVPGGAARAASLPAPAHPERLLRGLPQPEPFRIGR